MTAANGTLAKALLAFHKNAPSLPLDGINPHFSNKFTTLGAVMERVRAPLAEAGLTVAQFPTTVEGAPALRTRLTHESGEFLEDTMPLVLDKPNAQGLGSGITYARRYALLSILALVGDADDDGNLASTPSPQRPAAVATTQAAAGTPATATQAQQTAIKKLVAEIAPQQEGISMDVVLRNYGGDLMKVTGAQAEEILGKLTTLKGNLEKAA